MVTIEDFAKLEIKVITVLEAERMEGSEKLLKLIVDDGECKRQILSGIGKSYNPDDIIGKQIIAITNLEPRSMMGEKSCGMILASGDDLENITLIQPDKKVQAGSKIR